MLYFVAVYVNPAFIVLTDYMLFPCNPCCHLYLMYDIANKEGKMKLNL